jgi:tetraether lipid synthase
MTTSTSRTTSIASGKQEPPDHIAENLLRQRRQSILRFAEQNRQLPIATQATCPRCSQQVPAEFDWAGQNREQVSLRFDCPQCGGLEEAHDDMIWCRPPQSDRTGSAQKTYSGQLIKPNSRKLPRTVQTLCPECCALIVGRYFVEGGAVMIEKTCPEHGYFRDYINRDVRLFYKAAHWSFEEQQGLLNPHTTAETSCPADCGLCGRHQSNACLANVDLTNRCNLKCPICFANAQASGYVYEPDFEQVTAMLQALRDMRPTPATAVQFSGGEPTVHPRFHDIIAQAKKMGFSNIQIATNGLKMADYDFASKARDAGLHTLYLQFDGIGPEIYLKIRNRDIWEYKLKAMENCRRLNMKICLVPTIIRTVNDDQVGPIFDFAVENVDVVSAISYQPVCFTGRIEPEKRLQQRYTLGDLAHDLAKATGAVAERDFYPLSIVMPLSQFLESLTGDPKIKPSCHTECAFGTYFLISPEKKAYPFPQVIDVEAMFTGMNRLARKFAPRAGHINFLDKWRIFRLFKSAFRRGQAPPGLDVKKFLASLEGMVNKDKGRGEAGTSNYRTLMAAGMHFQDRYNYDVERVKRCVIPYSTPAGIFPFCAYNSGPTYRELVEKMGAEEGM